MFRVKINVLDINFVFLIGFVIVVLKLWVFPIMQREKREIRLGTHLVYSCKHRWLELEVLKCSVGAKWYLLSLKESLKPGYPLERRLRGDLIVQHQSRFTGIHCRPDLILIDDAAEDTDIGVYMVTV